MPCSSAYSQMVITGNIFANIVMISKAAVNEKIVIMISVLVGE